MKAKIPKYNEEGSKVIGEEEVEVIGQVKYIGDSCCLSFINGKIYNVIEVSGGSVRVIDEIEDYWYIFDDPTINFEEEGQKGNFKVVNDFTKDKVLLKLEEEINK